MSRLLLMGGGLLLGCEMDDGQYSELYDMPYLVNAMAGDDSLQKQASPGDKALETARLRLDGL